LQLVPLAQLSIRFAMVARIPSMGLFAALFAFRALHAEPSDVAIVRHAAPFKGNVVGSIQILTGETLTVEGTANLSGNLMVPGTPVITLKSGIHYGDTIVGPGNTAPSGYALTINTGGTLGHIVTRTDPIALPVVTAPSAPHGTRSVTIKTSTDSPGSFATLKNLTLEKNVGRFTIAGGSYGSFTAKTGTGFVLGVAGSAAPTDYDFQALALESGSTVTLIGPVRINLATGVTVNGNVGEPIEPSWLVLNISSGSLTLNSGYNIYGTVNAPNAGSLVTLKSSSQLVGGLRCDKLSIENGGTLRLVSATPNQPPSVSLTFPSDNAEFPAGGNIALSANAADADGTVARVDFYKGATLLGSSLNSPYQYVWESVPAGNHELSARAIDDAGATGASNAVRISVIAQPVVTSDPNATGQTGAPFTYQVTATNDPTSYSAIDLPSGLNINPSTGVISGTPVSPGRTVVTVPATNAGGSASNTFVLTILATLPYATDFETVEGYKVGSLDGQLGWTATQGTGSITAEDHANGTQSALLDANNPAAVFTQTFADAGEETVEYFDLLTKPTVQGDPTTGSAFTVEGATFGFQLNGSTGSVQIFRGNGSGGGDWSSTKFTFPLDGNQVAQTWVRLTARLDLVHHTWDLYANGAMVAADIPAAFASPFLSTFIARGSTSGLSRIDSVYAGPVNPLFADINNNGLDDTWETDHGLSLSNDNRNLSPSGSGVTVAQAYVDGTDPNDFYNGKTPTLTMIGGDNQVAPPGDFNASPLDIAVWNSVGTAPLVNAPVTFTVTQGGGALATSNGGDAQLVASVAQRTDADGTTRVYYKQPVAPGVISEITVRAGAAPPLIFRTQNFAAGGADSDGNGIPDEWENSYFGWVGVDPEGDEDEDGLTNLQEFQQGKNPIDYFNGETPVISILNGEGDPDGKLEISIHTPNGTPYPNAPVTFDVPPEEASFAGNPDSTIVHQNLTLRADANGVARIYLRPAPSQP